MMLAEIGCICGTCKEAHHSYGGNMPDQNRGTRKKASAAAPMKKIGVTIPPLPPKLKVTAVNIILTKRPPWEYFCLRARLE
jgi:hypothetical protein